MCISRLYKTCSTFFCRKKLSSFADKLVKMNHDYDELLELLFKKIKPTLSYQSYNPAPNNEHTVFYAHSSNERGRMLENNILLRSRVFIENARARQLTDSFQTSKTIRIIDIGCGYAHALLGILAYFGVEKVEYTGIDLDPNRIAECQKAYSEFKSVKFSCQNGLDFLEDKKNHDKFDVALMLHPNIESEICRQAFTKMFLNVNKVLALGGKLYSTLFYPSEAAYFKANVLPHMSLRGHLQQQACYRMFFQNRHTSEIYCPENFVYASGPK